MMHAVNNSAKQRGRPFEAGVSGNPAGRPKGSRNRRTTAVVEAAQSSGEMPLDYMLRVMRDDNADLRRRDEMARAAAPFLHAKLAAVEHSMPPDENRTTSIVVSFVKPSLQPNE